MLMYKQQDWAIIDYIFWGIDAYYKSDGDISFEDLTD